MGFRRFGKLVVRRASQRVRREMDVDIAEVRSRVDSGSLSHAILKLEPGWTGRV